MSLILAIDQGTTNTKALLVDRDGRPVYRASAPLTLFHPKPSFTEQDPLAILRSVDELIESCLACGQPIAAVAISNQRETVLAWDRHTGKPLTNAISWQCQRGMPICEALQHDNRELLLRERTGLGIDPLFSAAKLKWLMMNTPNLRDLAITGDVCFGTIDSWLLFHLTGKHATDHSNASRTQLLNLKTLAWDVDLLSLFDIPAAALPSLHTSSGYFADCTCAPLAGVPVLAAVGDSHAALAGHGSSAPGTVKATYGTGSSLMTLIDSVAFDAASRLSQTVAWTTPSATRYALEGNITMTGSAIQWLGELLGLANPVDDIVAQAATVRNSGGVHFVPAMAGLGAPHWDANARGTITGLGRSSSRAQLARAAVDSIAFQISDVFEAMQREVGVTLSALRADGGATRNDSLMQFQADILGCPVHRSTTEDLSALGAAHLAGLALGWWPSLEALAHETTTYAPSMEAWGRDLVRAEWQQAVRQARA